MINIEYWINIDVLHKLVEKMNSEIFFILRLILNRLYFEDGKWRNEFEIYNVSS